MGSKLYRLISVLSAIIALSACRPADQDGLWTMTNLSGDALDSIKPAEMSFFVHKGMGQHRLELFLLHDDRTEEENISLHIALVGRHDTIYQAEQSLSLAERPGLWTGKGLLYHERAFNLPKPLHIKYPGIYKLSIYSPMKPSPRGITLFGARLVRLDSLEH